MSEARPQRIIPSHECLSWLIRLVLTRSRTVAHRGTDMKGNWKLLQEIMGNGTQAIILDLISLAGQSHAYSPLLLAP